jgi:hypothetical protein
MARAFNGTSDLIAVSALAMTTNTNLVTLAAWIKTTVTPGAIICSDTGTARFAQFKISANKLQLIMFQGGTARTWVSVASVTDGTWHHVAGVYNGTTGFLYIDGALDTSSALTATNNGSGLNWRIGAQLPGVTQQFFAGSIAHPIIVSRALTAGEVKSVATGLLPSHLAPDHYWPLWGTDSPEPDVGNATHAAGALTGTTAAHDPGVGLNLLTLTS